MTINYQIQFLSDWHCGSGLSSGADADAEVLKDINMLPYVPGKTIKGLLRDAVSEMPFEAAGFEQETIDAIFGCERMVNGKITETKPGSAFFSNAELGEIEKKDLLGELADYLYKKKASTAIDDMGVAKSGSLRNIEVCIPVCLYGHIEVIKESERDIIEKALKWVRHIGVNRNRGLGRCKINLI
jgi:CRISPR/Cas system CSM-associated protein Csm3 (group 7 of RAMP superfamily)